MSFSSHYYEAENVVRNVNVREFVRRSQEAYRFHSKKLVDPETV